jgi:hypothetical protein
MADTYRFAELVSPFDNNACNASRPTNAAKAQGA